MYPPLLFLFQVTSLIFKIITQLERALLVQVLTHGECFAHEIHQFPQPFFKIHRKTCFCAADDPQMLLGEISQLRENDTGGTGGRGEVFILNGGVDPGISRFLDLLI